MMTEKAPKFNSTIEVAIGLSKLESLALDIQENKEQITDIRNSREALIKELKLEILEKIKETNERVESLDVLLRDTEFGIAARVRTIEKWKQMVSKAIWPIITGLIGSATLAVWEVIKAS